MLAFNPAATLCPPQEEPIRKRWTRSAAARIPALEASHATWLEEPFHTSALEANSALSRRSRTVKLAGGGLR